MPLTAIHPPISLSSSGYADGLGRRTLEIDRETGEMIERLTLRPELVAFEQALTDRVAGGAAIKDERFAHPRQVSRDDEGHLTVRSTYVGGRRLCDVLDVAAVAGVIGGIDAAIGFLLELLPALSFLHSEMKFAHGVLGTGRLTVTPSGSLVVLDWVYGAPVEHLQLTRQRLWDELGVAVHPSAGPPRLDRPSDLTQAAMIAASLIVGRPLGDSDYPHGIPALRAEIIEVAHIRGNQDFSRGIERFFDRLLPLGPRRLFSSADEALFELRMLVRNTIAIEPCRAAFRELLNEAESIDPERADGASKTAGPSHEHRIDENPKQTGRSTKKSAVTVKSGGKSAIKPADRAETERAAEEQRAREDAEREARLRAEAERLERERVERERAARAKAEAERLAAEKAEAERIAREQAEAERTARLASAPADPEPRVAQPADGGRRRKKDRSAHTRQDKLQSARAVSAVPSDPAVPASFEPGEPAVAPPAPVFAPAIQTAAPPMPVYAPAPPPPLAPAANTSDALPTFQPIKLKAPEGRRHGTLTRASAQPLSITAPPPEPTESSPDEDLDGGRRIPWKPLAAAAVILMAGGYAALTLRSAPPAKPAPSPAPVAAPAPPPATPPPSAPAATVGTVEITTQPKGARVLFDGKAAGQSPLTLPNVAPGRHTVTLVGDTGSVKRTIKVDAGETARVDVSIFSGFAAISAPIVLDVSENGRGLGTSDNQVMLTPGRHDLLLTNKDLQYSTTATVDVEPGEVKQIKLDPRGSANINAQPWAEVWIDGAKVGETPLANLSLPLGSRDIVFRNPKFGERKVTATITAGAPATISIDFSK